MRPNPTTRACRAAWHRTRLSAYGRAEGRPQPGFGEYLRGLRHGARLTQAQLAERSGLTTDAIAALERGRRRHPYPHRVLALSAALNLPSEEHSLLVRLAARRRSSPAAPSNGHSLAKLPTSLTELIGRSRQSTTLHRLLDDSSDARLVSVVGVGGVGKTAFALRVAGELWARFPDGMHLGAAACQRAYLVATA
ncbi:MAG: helix-turn-helix domain-containing protein [Chloroflexota bacterium]